MPLPRNKVLAQKVAGSLTCAWSPSALEQSASVVLGWHRLASSHQSVAACSSTLCMQLQAVRQRGRQRQRRRLGVAGLELAQAVDHLLRSGARAGVVCPELLNELPSCLWRLLRHPATAHACHEVTEIGRQSCRFIARTTGRGCLCISRASWHSSTAAHGTAQGTNCCSWLSLDEDQHNRMTCSQTGILYQSRSLLDVWQLAIDSIRLPRPLTSNDLPVITRYSVRKGAA